MGDPMYLRRLVRITKIGRNRRRLVHVCYGVEHPEWVKLKSAPWAFRVARIGQWFTVWTISDWCFGSIVWMSHPLSDLELFYAECVSLRWSNVWPPAGLDAGISGRRGPQCPKEKIESC